MDPPRHADCLVKNHVTRQSIFTGTGVESWLRGGCLLSLPPVPRALDATGVPHALDRVKSREFEMHDVLEVSKEMDIE